MSVDIGKFWGTDYDHNPPLTNEMLEQAEQFLGVKIPKELTALWRVQNGMMRAHVVWMPSEQLRACETNEDLAALLNAQVPGIVLE